MHGIVYGTVTGATIVILFGLYGVAECGIRGGIFGVTRNYVTSAEPTPPEFQQTKKEIL